MVKLPSFCHRQALEAELAGEYDVALAMYKNLLKRYDNRYEKEGESQESLRDTEENEEEEGGIGEGEGDIYIFIPEFPPKILMGTHWNPWDSHVISREPVGRPTRTDGIP